tara:strand:- start:1233 stop:1454 length:222 start_codon:yes stop_codon:yes gene_type:complete
MKNKLKLKGRKYDGKSRVSNDLYRKNYDEIFKKNPEDPFQKEQDELNESYKQSKLNKKEREELLKEIEDRNGF